MKACWNGAVIAQSDATVVVGGNHYFPADSITREYFRKSEHSTVCGWKGTAAYYDVVVDGKVNTNAAWYYEQPKTKADNIRGMIAFWNQVEVVEG